MVGILFGVPCHHCHQKGNHESERKTISFRFAFVCLPPLIVTNKFKFEASTVGLRPGSPMKAPFKFLLSAPFFSPQGSTTQEFDFRLDCFLIVSCGKQVALGSPDSSWIQKLAQIHGFMARAGSGAVAVLLPGSVARHGGDSGLLQHQQ